MNDPFLYGLRKMPSAQFAEDLRRRLQQQSLIDAQHRRQPLLRAAWDGDAIVLTLFERGRWEAEFLQLASPTSRPRR